MFRNEVGWRRQSIDILLTPTVLHKNNFDFVRLFAALLVLFSHQQTLVGLHTPAIAGRTIATLGVFIFFSISGYLVASSWRRSRSIGVFARHRLVRIWPGYAVATLFALFVVGPVATTLSLKEYFSSPVTWSYLNQLYFGGEIGLPGVFQSNPLPMAVNGSLWTIPIELNWYVLLAVAGLLRLLDRPRLLLAVTGVLAVYVMQQHYTGKPGFADPFYEFGLCFALGATFSGFRAPLLAARGSALAVMAALAAVLTCFDFVYAALFISIPLTSIIVGESNTAVIRRFGRFGDFSYGVYLYAFPVQQLIVWATKNHMPFLGQLALGMAITLACAVLSWKFIESPALRFKARRRHDESGTTPAVA